MKTCHSLQSILGEIRPHGASAKSENSVRKRYRGIVLGLLTAGTSLALSKPALAQETGKEFSAQRFDAPAGPRNYITTRGARTDGEMAWSAGLVMSYAYKPLTVDSCVADAPNCEGTNSITLNVVENLVQGDLMGSLTPFPRLQIGLRVPVAYAKGTGIDRTSTDPASLGTDDPIEDVGLGDPELELKFRAYGEPKDIIVAGAALYVTAPLGHATMPGAFVGDETPGVGLRLIFDGEAGQFSFGGNIGGVLRGTGSLETPVLASEATVGSELRYSVAGGWRPSPILRAVVDMFGSSRLSTVPRRKRARARRRHSGRTLRRPHHRGWRRHESHQRRGDPVVARVPRFRLRRRETRSRRGRHRRQGRSVSRPSPKIATATRTPTVAPISTTISIRCPTRPTSAPAQAEDVDGFEDNDGCPELDNDKDGVPDTGDRCTNEPETVNGFDDADGCPDVTDNDRDGVPDDKDQCKDGPEDTDGFEDTDGCPDPDNDKDGLPDNQDECVDEPETINKFEDTDGCPDEKPKR